MPGDVLPFPQARQEPLKVPGCGRDAEAPKSLCFYFTRPVTDAEMRFLHEVVQRAVACMPNDIEADYAR